MSSPSSDMHRLSRENYYSTASDDSHYSEGIISEKYARRQSCKWAAAALLLCVVLNSGTLAVVLWQGQSAEEALRELRRAVAQIRDPSRIAELAATAAAHSNEKARLPVEVEPTVLAALAIATRKANPTVAPPATPVPTMLQCQAASDGLSHCDASYPNMCGVNNWKPTRVGTMHNDCAADGNITINIAANYILLSQAQFEGAIEKSLPAATPDAHGTSTPKTILHELVKFSRGRVEIISTSKHIRLDVLSSQVVMVMRLKEADKVAVYLSSTRNTNASWQSTSLVLVPVK